MAEKPATVTVEALKPHSAFGETYAVGDTYDLPAEHVDSVAAQGMAVRVDRVAHAKRLAAPMKPAATSAKARKPKK